MSDTKDPKSLKTVRLAKRHIIWESKGRKFPTVGVPKQVKATQKGTSRNTGIHVIRSMSFHAPLDAIGIESIVVAGSVVWLNPDIDARAPMNTALACGGRARLTRRLIDGEVVHTSLEFSDLPKQKDGLDQKILVVFSMKVHREEA